MPILNLKDSELITEIALNHLKQGKTEEAVILLNRIKEKDRNSLLILLECYQRLNLPFSVIQTLEKLIELKPSKLFYQSLIQESRKVKQYRKAFHYARQGEKVFSHDPDFKKEILDLLLLNARYVTALHYLKKNRYAFPEEKFLLDRARIYRETGKNWKSLAVLSRLVKSHPFNILYRYLLSSAWENLGFKKYAQKHLNFIKDFVTQIPKIAMGGPVQEQKTSFETVMNHLWEQSR